MKKFGLRSLSILLSILMVLYLLPMAVFADSFAESKKEKAQNNISQEDRSAISELFELEELREETVKHFRLEDGSIIAVQYDDPVHYLDTDGKWQDIDNTLSSSGSEYVTSNARVKFAKKTTGNEVLMTLHDGNRKLTLSLDGARKKVSGQVMNYTSELNDDIPKIQKVTALDKLSASILYADILDGVDLEYVAVSNNVKENIIVKSEKNTYSYTFTLKLNNLTAALQDNEIIVSDEKTGETVYVIPAPYMYDAAEEYSDAVSYSLVQSGNKEYKLTVTADPEWINDSDRVFPVTIDPSLNSPHSSVTTTNIVSMLPDMNMGNYAFLNVGAEAYAYWKTTSLPDIPDSAYITNAVFAMNSEGNNLSVVGAYPVTSSWDTTLTWNKMLAGQGSFSSYIDYGTISSGSLCEWNITSLLKEWYSGETTNYGLCFKNITGTDVSKFTSIKSTNPTIRPRLIVTYRDMKGLESYWSYTSQSAGMAGTGYVNNATGNLVFTIPTLTTTDFLMPFTPTLVYNASLGDEYKIAVNAETAYKYSSAGYGFKWNMCESLLLKQYYNPNGVLMSYYVWSDSDGTEHAFMPTGTADVYVDEDGLMLTLIYDGSETFIIRDNEQNMRVFAKRASSSYFNSGAILQYIMDKNGNAIEFTSDSYGRVTGIGLWPSGQSRIDMLKFSYNNYGLVNRVYNEVTGESVIFYYSDTPAATTLISTSNDGYLRKIVRAHHTGDNDEADWTSFMNNGYHADIEIDGIATYVYGGNARLLKARDEVAGYEIQYSYNIGKKVATVQEATSEVGQRLGFTYGSSYTEIRSSGTDDVYGTADDLVNRYTFDTMGRAKGAYSTDLSRSTIYGASSAEYEDGGNVANKIKKSSYIGGTSPNLLLNGGFEQNQFLPTLSYWNTTANVSKITTTNHNHAASFEIKAGQIDSVSQYVFLPAGEYTLSMLYNTYDCANVDITMRAESLSGGTSYSNSVPVNEHYTDVSNSSLSMRITASNKVNGGERFKISVQATGKTGTASDAVLEVDDLLLEQNIAPTKFSLVQLGGFDSPTINASGSTLYTPSDFWMDRYIVSSIVSTETPFGNVLSVPGLIYTNAAPGVLQAVYTASSEDISNYNASKIYEPATYQISGFGKGTQQLMNSNSKFGITVTVKYYRGAGVEEETEDFHFAFEPGSTDWQFVSGAFTTKDKPGYLVHEITVACEYSNHPGTAYFDNISVYPSDHEAVKENEYYEDGRLKRSRSGSYIERYKYDEGATDIDEDGPRPKIYTIINNRGDCVEYHYNLDDQITNNVQVIKYYRYSGNFAYESDSPINEDTKIQKSATTYTYDEFGNVLSQSISYFDNLNPKVLHSSATYETTSGSRIFGAMTSETDGLGNTTRYFYHSSKDYLMAVIMPNNQGIAYYYDSIGNLQYTLPAYYNSSTGLYSGSTGGEAVYYGYDSKK